MKLKRHSLLLIICLFIFSISMFLVFYNAKAATGPGISITPEYPKEQIKKNGIFNVVFKPSQYYNLTFRINNTNSEQKTVNISPNTAYTSNNGGLVFSNSKPPSDSSKKYDFRSLFKQKEEKIIIPANSTKRVNFELKMPPKLYRGIILGGFYITIPNINNSNIKGNFTVNNTFSYGLPVAIHNNKEEYQPKIQLGKIALQNNNDQTQVNSNIRNVGSAVISGMDIRSNIVKNNNGKSIIKSDNRNLSMAPNSSFNYLDVTDNSLSPGKYKAKFIITDDSGHTWNEIKDFRVNAREYVTHFTQKVPWTLYILIGVIVLLALVIIFLVYYQFKNNKKKDKQLKDDSKK